MTDRSRPIGGVIHSYQKYDPKHFPSPTQPPPDLVSSAMQHLLYYGGRRRLTAEELAGAVHLDASQIAGLGPSLEALIEMLRQRKAKILQTYETESVHQQARRRFQQFAATLRLPAELQEPYRLAISQQQLFELERLWYRLDRKHHPAAATVMGLVARLGDKYQIDELVAKYEFTGRTALSIPESLAVKEELEAIDRLLKQLEEAAQNAQVAIIDLDELARFAEQADIDQLRELNRQIQQYIETLAEQQGLERTADGYQMTPKAMRVFQGHMLDRIFSNLEPSRTGRHTGTIIGEGAVELQQTRSYEFGDSLANIDVVSSMINAMTRTGTQLPIRWNADDIEVHKTRNTPKCATVVLLDMSGSMRYDGLYVDVKRMSLALDGLIRKHYPGDYLQFIEIASIAKPRHVSQLAGLLPKPVTITDPVVRLRADMSDPRITELDIPPHFTNIQHGLQLARRFLGSQDTPNRQIILITDGLPTAHFEDHTLWLLYPPDDRTEQATLREGALAARDGITINIFLLSTWFQSQEDVQFAHRLARSTAGRVFFTAGDQLDRYVVWDYLNQRREIVG